MNPRIWAAGLCAAIIAAAALATPPAQAAQKKRVATQTKERVVTTRPRARITVRSRSFLDGGTEVLPGDRKFTDYALPPGYSPMSVLENHVGGNRFPLPGPFDLPGRDNPWPWNWCVGC
jgi:hypothetical protein